MAVERLQVFFNSVYLSGPEREAEADTERKEEYGVKELVTGSGI